MKKMIGTIILTTVLMVAGCSSDQTDDKNTNNNVHENVSNDHMDIVHNDAHNQAENAVEHEAEQVDPARHDNDRNGDEQNDDNLNDDSNDHAVEDNIQNDEDQKTNEQNDHEDDTTIGQPDELDTVNVYALNINGQIIGLRNWDHEVNLKEIMGPPVSETIEQLENAATHTESWIKYTEYDGLQMELFSPAHNGENFWIMTIKVFKEGYKTAAGVEVGQTLEELKTVYPGIKMALDGRTDPVNAAYMINGEYEHLKFEVKDGIVTEIHIYYLLP